MTRPFYSPTTPETLTVNTKELLNLVQALKSIQNIDPNTTPAQIIMPNGWINRAGGTPISLAQKLADSAMNHLQDAMPDDEWHNRIIDQF